MDALIAFAASIVSCDQSVVLTMKTSLCIGAWSRDKGGFCASAGAYLYLPAWAAAEASWCLSGRYPGAVPHPDAGRFLTIPQVAEELATSEAQISALVKRGDLVAIKLGGRGQWRIERSKLEEFI